MSGISIAGAIIVIFNSVLPFLFAKRDDLDNELIDFRKKLKNCFKEYSLDYSISISQIPDRSTFKTSQEFVKYQEIHFLSIETYQYLRVVKFICKKTFYLFVTLVIICIISISIGFFFEYVVKYNADEHIFLYSALYLIIPIIISIIEWFLFALLHFIKNRIQEYKDKFNEDFNYEGEINS